jgi:hypothetical protein
MGSKGLRRGCESLLEDGALTRYHDPVLMDFIRSCVISTLYLELTIRKRRDGCGGNQVGCDIEN